ncbi:27716_t:CDS:2, partial [Gigaspora margarita]
LISRTSDKVSLTFDLWSSRAHDSYFGITCHWLTDLFDLHEIMLNIGELDEHHVSDIIEAVYFVLNKFNINCQKVFSITTDNSSNVKSAVQQMGIPNMKCARHTLQLSVNLGLKEVDELISKCKALILILSKEKKHRQLHEAQLQYPTLGFMTPILEELARRLRYFIGQNSMAILVEDTILDNLIERWGDPSEIGMCCFFLDPRFKKLNFCTSALRRTTIQSMR